MIAHGKHLIPADPDQLRAEARPTTRRTPHRLRRYWPLAPIQPIARPIPGRGSRPGPGDRGSPAPAGRAPRASPQPRGDNGWQPAGAAAAGEARCFTSSPTAADASAISSRRLGIGVGGAGEAHPAAGHHAEIHSPLLKATGRLEPTAVEPEGESLVGLEGEIGRLSAARGSLQQRRRSLASPRRRPRTAGCEARPPLPEAAPGLPCRSLHPAGSSGSRRPPHRPGPGSRTGSPPGRPA